jgi:hypothetical protein
MPRGVRNVNTVAGIDGQIAALDKAITSLQSEIDEKRDERNKLIDAKKALIRDQLVDEIMASGKSVEEVRNALAL